MTANLGLIFIDANQYLRLYGMSTGKPLLKALTSLKTHLFVTSQVVEEVHRNKVNVAAAYLVGEFKRLQLPGFGVPDHLLANPGERGHKVREMLSKLNSDAKAVKDELDKLAFEMLRQISQSTDDVSNALRPFFDSAANPSEQELHRARDRRERGIPPGKSDDPLGDQISWEQILTRCRVSKNLWLITRDSDFATQWNKEFFLNASLFADLKRLENTPDVYCFEDPIAGIEHFAQKAGIKPQQLLTREEATKFREEQESLPDLRPKWKVITNDFREWMRSETAQAIIRKGLQAAVTGDPTIAASEVLAETALRAMGKGKLNE